MLYLNDGQMVFAAKGIEIQSLALPRRCFV